MVMDYIIEDLMEEVVERKGSDLHISQDFPLTSVLMGTSPVPIAIHLPQKKLSD